MICRLKINLPKILVLLITISFPVISYSKNSAVVVDQVHFPTPTQMRPLENTLPEYLAKMISAPENSSSRRLATYLPIREMEAISQGMKPILERYCLLQVNKHFLQQRITVSHFRSINDALFEKLSQFKTMGDVIKETETLGGNVISETSKIASVPLEYLGISTRGDNYVIYSCAVFSPGASSDPTARVQFVVTTGALLLNGHYFELSALSKYRDDNDLRWARETVREWINQTNVDNKSIPIAPKDNLNLVTAGIGLLLFILILLFFRRFSNKLKNSRPGELEK